jgi:hypothetical protein
MFWQWYRRMTREHSVGIENETENLGAHSYSPITRKAFNYLLALGDSIVEYGLTEEGNRLDEQGAIFALMESVRYKGKLEIEVRE